MVLTCIFFMDVTLGDLCMPGANAFCARVLCSRSHVDNAGMSENQTLGDAWPTTANLRSPVSSAQNAFQLVSTELSGCHSMFAAAIRSSQIFHCFLSCSGAIPQGEIPRVVLFRKPTNFRFVASSTMHESCQSSSIEM